MSFKSSPALSSATVSLASEASWDSCHRTDTPTPIPKTNDTPLDNQGDKVTLGPGPVAMSDVGSPAPLELSESADHADVSDQNPESKDAQPSPIMINEPAVDPEFCFADSNITVQVEESLFRVHEYKLSEFQNLKPQIEATETNLEGHKTLGLAGSAVDIRNIFTVLYSSAYAPHSFDAATLKSTLRLATLYGHAQLRTFAIEKLEKATLLPIVRFALSRDCGVDSWMSKALDDLCWREEPLTAEEGEVLGMKKFAEVAARREGVKFERGSRVMLSTSVPTPAPSVVKAAKQIAPPAPVPPPASKPTTVPNNTTAPKPASSGFVWNALGASASTLPNNASAPTGFSFGKPVSTAAPASASTHPLPRFGSFAPTPTSGSDSKAQVPPPSGLSIASNGFLGFGSQKPRGE